MGITIFNMWIQNAAHVCSAPRLRISLVAGHRSIT